MFEKFLERMKRVVVRGADLETVEIETAIEPTKVARTMTLRLKNGFTVVLDEEAVDACGKAMTAKRGEIMKQAGGTLLDLLADLGKKSGEDEEEHAKTCKPCADRLAERKASAS